MATSKTYIFEDELCCPNSFWKQTYKHKICGRKAFFARKLASLQHAKYNDKSLQKKIYFEYMKNIAIY